MNGGVKDWFASGRRRFLFYLFALVVPHIKRTRKRRRFSRLAEELLPPSLAGGERRCSSPCRRRKPGFVSRHQQFIARFIYFSEAVASVSAERGTPGMLRLAAAPEALHSFLLGHRLPDVGYF